MVVELTDEELLLIGESLNIYIYTLKATRDGFNNVKNDTHNPKTKLELQHEINYAESLIQTGKDLLTKLNIEEDDILKI